MQDIDVHVSLYKILNMTIGNRRPKPIPNDTASKSLNLTIDGSINKICIGVNFKFLMLRNSEQPKIIS
jgi:hypothetical protein